MDPLASRHSAPTNRTCSPSCVVDSTSSQQSNESRAAPYFSTMSKQMLSIDLAPTELNSMRWHRHPNELFRQLRTVTASGRHRRRSLLHRLVAHCTVCRYKVPAYTERISDAGIVLRGITWAFARSSLHLADGDGLFCSARQQTDAPAKPKKVSPKGIRHSWNLRELLAEMGWNVHLSSAPELLPS